MMVDCTIISVDINAIHRMPCMETADHKIAPSCSSFSLKVLSSPSDMSSPSDKFIKITFYMAPYLFCDSQMTSQ